jgi:hypothetical protein
VTFDTTDPAFAGEMTFVTAFTQVAGGTEVTLSFDGIPFGVHPDDNEPGSRQSVEQLARYVARVTPAGCWNSSGTNWPGRNSP